MVGLDIGSIDFVRVRRWLGISAGFVSGDFGVMGRGGVELV
jgi:hypothetical protein